MSRVMWSTVWGLAVAAMLALGAANLWLGELNQDEGWYLYAARQVAEGGLPYVDFSYTQAPVMPFVYRLAVPLIDAWGVAGGRLFTAVLGMAAVLLAGLAASRATRSRLPMLLTVLLAGINVYQSYFTTVVKTYALCGFFLALGFWLLAETVRRKGWGAAAAAGAALALASGVRISSGITLPIVFAGLVFEAWRGRLPWRPAIGFAAGGGLVLLGIFVPFLAAAPDSAWFHLVEYHSARSPGSLAGLLVYKAGFLSRVVQAYFLVTALLVALVLFRVLSPRRLWLERVSARSWLGITGWSIAGITLVHLAAPFPYDDYQAPVYPLLAAALAAALSGLLDRCPDAARPRTEKLLVWFLLFASLASAGSSPINQQWMIAGRDRIWWLLKPEAAMPQLKDAARRIHALAPDGRLLTQDIYLAVEAGLEVPEGMGMGPFSYYPAWSDEQAATRHVMNRAILTNLLATTDIPVAAVSDYGFSIASPAIEPVPDDERAELMALLEGRYDLADILEGFGQAGTTLRLYTLKPGAAAR